MSVYQRLISKLGSVNTEQFFCEEVFLITLDLNLTPPLTSENAKGFALVLISSDQQHRTEW